MSETYIRQEQLETNEFYCRLTKTADQTISDATDTVVTWDSEVTDAKGMHDNATNNSRVTIPSDGGGVYLINFGQVWTSNATGARHIKLVVNGTTETEFQVNQNESEGYGGVYAENFPFTWKLSGGDYIEIEIKQRSGGSLDFKSSSYLDVVRILPL